MIKHLQQTVLAMSLAAGISLSAYAQPPEDAKGPHDFGAGGPGPACAAAFGHGPESGVQDGPMHGMPPAWPHGPMEHPGMEPELGPPPFLFGLDLNEGQQDKIFSIQLANAPLLREQEKLAHKNGRELHALLEQDQYDEAKVKSLAEAQAHAMAQLEVLHARGMHQILAVLTPEQKTKLNAMKEKFAGPHHGEEH
jgi:Spy/CpxP family protein refolding chaperone